MKRLVRRVALFAVLVVPASVLPAPGSPGQGAPPAALAPASARAASGDVLELPPPPARQPRSPFLEPDSFAPGSAPYSADPLGLVAFQDTVGKAHSAGTDTWEVWICQPANPNMTLDPATVTADLNANLNPFFSWLSEGRYTTSFVVGGEFTSTDVIPSDGSFPTFGDCEAKAEAISTSGPNGAMIVVEGSFASGYGTPGFLCPDPALYGTCPATYPDNSRKVVVGGASVQTAGSFGQPVWSTAAHEIGHALSWPHSYSGLTTFSGGGINEYDNPMDVMSALQAINVLATIGFNRYAAGWIDPSQVAVHSGPGATYTLNTVGNAGTQMVIIPVGQGHFYTLNARMASSFDALEPIPKAGVEVYEVDQSSTVCSDGWPPGWPCFSTSARIKQVPGASGYETLHVFGVGQQTTVAGIPVAVTASGPTSFTVTVGTVAPSGTFVDDDGNFHEPNIEAIAAAGIDTGCNFPDNTMFCPADPMTRAMMAAWLIKALGEEGNIPAYQGYFTDVPAGLWYTGYAERLFELGVTLGVGGGLYDPDGTVTRAQMAVFLIRAFDNEAALAAATGLFGDILIADASTSWYRDHVERLYAMGITTGCSATPLLYCPDVTVPRDQMASFVSRAMGIAVV